jgi:opacity protein-like surface antigen
MRTLLLVLLVAAPPVTLALVPDPPRTTYVFGKIGVVIPESDDLRGYDDGFALEAGVGFRFAKHLAVEGSIGNFKMSFTQSGSDPALGSFTNTGNLNATPVLATLKLFGRSGLFELFGAAGVGVYFVSFSGTVSSGAGASSQSDSDTRLGFHLGGGVSVFLSPQLSVGGEAKYVLAKVSLLGQTSNINSLLVTATAGYAF